jgi:hypothetical protein
MIKTHCIMRIKTQIVDAATGAIVKDNRWNKNLILDYGLTTIAGGNTLGLRPPEVFTNCQVGSGTNPTSINSGAVTIDSSGTTLTASSSFFTARMVGALLKWGATGSAGVEVYIASVTSGTVAVCATSQTHTTEAATVWFVQESALQTLLYTSSTYQTTAGSCQTTVTGGVITHKRTFTFPVQASPYTVNEIGYKASSGTLNGRIVLPSSDVVAPTNFYVVIMSLSIAYTPRVPTAVSNVGTNIDTSGDSCIEHFDVSFVASNGTTQNTGITSGLDPINMVGSNIVFPTQTFSQPASTPDTITNTPQPFSAYLNFTGAPTKTNPSIGVAVLTWANVSLSTSGQTLYGYSMNDGGNRFAWTLKFTTPITAPTGTMQLTGVTFTVVYARVLTN